MGGQPNFRAFSCICPSLRNSSSHCYWLCNCVPHCGRVASGLLKDQWLTTGPQDWGLVSAFPWGFGSGMLFVLGPLGVEYAVAVKVSDPSSILAQEPATYAVSIWQTGILVSGLWGILFFKEMNTVASIIIFLLGAGVLLTGIVVSGHAIV